MEEPTVESIFGINAGIVWEALNENGACTVAELAKCTGLSREAVCGALGWLGRENKVTVKMGEGKGRKTTVFSLQP